jgi:uncharacterized sporulation protein YeaH/YhbH (DUF444 family)
MKNKKTYRQTTGIRKFNPAIRDLIQREMKLSEKLSGHGISSAQTSFPDLYSLNDSSLFLGYNNFNRLYSAMQTLDELLERDKKREEDGFPRRIRLGKFIKPDKENKERVVVVPTTTEPKFYHDNSLTTEEETTGGSGEGEEGEVLGEQQVSPQEGEGEGSGAGQGGGAAHDIETGAFDLGRVLTEQFKLPNLKVKGRKPSLTKYRYDLTDKNKGFGQVLDKKASVKKILETNILLGNIDGNSDFNTDNLVINPQDKIYRILSKEKDFDSQAIVFFIRDYSGSMQGKPTEVIVTQHLFIYSWLMFQYRKQVKHRFILHDTEAKEVPDFYTYYKSAVAGGTNVYPSYEMVLDIIEKEQLARDYNIYIFHGTDGDDWEENGDRAVAAVQKLLPYISRMGISIAKNSWAAESAQTIVEQYYEKSGLLVQKHELLRLDVMQADDASENRIIEGIKKLVS